MATTPLPADPASTRPPSAEDTERKGLEPPETVLEVADVAAFSVRALAAVPGSLRFTSEILRQTGILIRGSTLYLATLNFLLGVLFVTFAYTFLKAAAAYDYIVAFTGQINPRLFVPYAFGWAFASKVCCGMVSEIGAMRISEEIDALETEGVSALKYVVGTRIVAAMIYAPIAAVVGLLAQSFGNAFNAIIVLNALDPATFWSLHWSLQNITDQLLCTVCLMTEALVMTLVACAYGFHASGGPSGVGSAVARSLRVNLVASFFITAVFVSALHGLDPDLPFGG